MRFTRRILGSFAALSIFAALPSSADLGDYDSIARRFADPPIYCAAIAANRRICTWHDGAVQHYVCEFDAEGRRVGGPCIEREDNTSMVTYPRSIDKFTSRVRRVKKKEICQGEFAALETAQSVRQVSEFVGAGPKSCATDGEHLVCTWHAVRRTPGYISLARITRTPGKKIDMTCQFQDRGQSRDSGSCRAYVAGKTPPDADQYTACQ